MATNWILHIAQYGSLLTEFGLLVYVIARGQLKKSAGVAAYISALLGGGLVRAWILQSYGLSSREYAGTFWSTDVLLGWGAFLLVCAFFRRACVGNALLWKHVRLLLVLVFVITSAVSIFSVFHNHNLLFTRFIVELQQNLYFTNLVLNTLLYLLVQRMEGRDDELDFFVGGLGMQLAGPAACFALFRLTGGDALARTITTYFGPFCGLGMLLTWVYAVARARKAVPALEPRRSQETLSAKVLVHS